jgi:glucose/arabinose dehydrogenase
MLSIVDGLRRLLALALIVIVAGCGGGKTAFGARSAGPTGVRAPSTPKQPGGAPGAVASGGVRLVRVGTFVQPLYVTAPPADRRRLFVVGRKGLIWVLRDGHALRRPFLDLRALVGSSFIEQGLLSMAFAPDYAHSGFFYVDYTDRSGDSRIVEYRRKAHDPDRAEQSSARPVLFQRHPEQNHNGGLLLFGPDAKLYVGFGDGGGANDQHGSYGNAQNLSTLLGKILRIDPRPGDGRSYQAPADNPFAHRQGARAEIYDYGLRNPWRYSFDRRTGDMIIADVGQDAFEEIDFAPRGRTAGINYGWRLWEARRRNYPGERAPGAVFPVLDYRTHVGGTCAIIGGVVVRDPGLPRLFGRYLYGDSCAGFIRSVRLGPGIARGDRSLPVHVPGISSFGEDAQGRIYVASLQGPVYRLR